MNGELIARSRDRASWEVGLDADSNAKQTNLNSLPARKCNPRYCKWQHELAASSKQASALRPSCGLGVLNAQHCQGRRPSFSRVMRSPSARPPSPPPVTASGNLAGLLAAQAKDRHEIGPGRACKMFGKAGILSRLSVCERLSRLLLLPYSVLAHLTPLPDDARHASSAVWRRVSAPRRAQWTAGSRLGAVGLASFPPHSWSLKA